MKSGWYLFRKTLGFVLVKDYTGVLFYAGRNRGVVYNNERLISDYIHSKPYSYFLNHSTPTIKELQVMSLVDKSNYDIYLTINKELDRLGVVG